ncbi:MAG TPA: prephenate dehydrogenase/arogenate dehydrogenase family protein [Pelomicrobium sp.]|nr:prephenate dehydrogenase/arogenate dehydrogenase family protein [Pelomicrobium sp.]
MNAAQASRPAIAKLVVIGVGLIGASAALALRAAGSVGRVFGIGRSQANLDEAMAGGAIDAVGRYDAETLADADIVLVAVPVAQTGAVLAALAPWIGPGTVVTDAGSTKHDVVAIARARLGDAFARFVPAHPVAGAERSGAAAAAPGLYAGRHVILTPVAETSAEAIGTVERMWRFCGAHVTRMAPDRHDEVLAAVSHLPHVLAFALVGRLAGQPDADEFFDLAGPGFRDFTRIAASSPEMWRDICLANREALLAALDGYLDVVGALREQIATGDGEALLEAFARASAARLNWTGCQ